MKKVKIVVLLCVVVAIAIWVNVVYNKMDDLSIETELRILISDVKNSENIFDDNKFDVRTDYFIFDGYVLTDLGYSTNDLVYDIYCRTSECSILGKKPTGAVFCINIDDDKYTVYYNDDHITYTEEYINSVENIFTEKINTVFTQYTEATYTKIHKNKFHFFVQYLWRQLEL